MLRPVAETDILLNCATEKIGLLGHKSDPFAELIKSISRTSTPLIKIFPADTS